MLCRYPRLRESTNHTTAAMTAMTTMAMITLPIASLCTMASTLAHQRMVVFQHAETQRIGEEWTRLSLPLAHTPQTLTRQPRAAHDDVYVGHPRIHLIHLLGRTVLGLAYIFLAISTHLLLKSFTFMSMCGMNQDSPVSVSSFPFPTYYPDTGTGSEDLNRTFVGPPAQPLLKQTSRCLTPFHILSPTHPLLRASM